MLIMSTMSGLPKSFKLLQSRLFCLSKMQSRATMSSSTLQIVHNVRSLDTCNRYCVSSRYGCHRLGLRSQLTSAYCKVINRKLGTFSFCNIPPHQTVRALSTSGTVEGVFSNRSSSDVKPSEENLIYRGPLSNMVKMVKLFSLSTSGMSVLILQMMFMTNESGALKVIGGSMATILLLTPIVLHWITKSYVTKIYFDRAKDTYTAYTLNFFLTTSKWEFTPADVEIPAIRNLMTSVLVKGKPLLLNPVAFYHPNHYSHLMGYDKLPDNFSLEEIEKAYAADSDEEQRKD